MKKFEYCSVTREELKHNYKNDYIVLDDNIYTYKELNDFGRNGWELVSVTETYATGATYYFKREIV